MKVNYSHAAFFLLIGLLLGASFGRWSAFRPGFMHSPSKRGEWMLKKLTKELELAADQREKIKTIIESKKQKLNELRGEMRPRFDAIWAESHREIEALLDENQKKKFVQLQKKMEENRRRSKRFRGEGSGPGGSPPPPASR